MSQGADGGAKRGRGRPAKLSQERIVDVAVRLARSDPARPLTIRRVTEAAGSAPMALYRYFPDRDDLLRAVADRILADIPLESPHGASWQEELRAWMEHSRAALVPYPQLVQYVADTRQSAWLPSFPVLRQMLSPLRLADEDLALAVVIVGTTVVGYACVEARRRPVEDTQHDLRSAVADLPPAAGARALSIVECLPGAMDRLYGVVIDQTIAAVAGLGRRRG
ncbi:MAG: helix-turn-helix transcriptional regulator [Streptomycetaceae bacterium]|nr:helix-turn-helix transcriptional regulator [Streptomycetaceae bacterium]